jgi:hypothetical protein
MEVPSRIEEDVRNLMQAKRAGWLDEEEFEAELKTLKTLLQRPFKPQSSVTPEGFQEMEQCDSHCIVAELVAELCDFGGRICGRNAQN